MSETGRYLRDACLAWEKWRVAYNLVLFLEYHMIPLRAKALVASQISFPYWVLYALCVFIANGFYCLGPSFEIYACVLPPAHGSRSVSAPCRRVSLFHAVDGGD